MICCNHSGDRVLLTTGQKLELVEQLLMRAALELHFLKIGNPVTDQSIVIRVLIGSYTVFYLHVKFVDEIHVYTCETCIECSLCVLCTVQLSNDN